MASSTYEANESVKKYGEYQEGGKDIQVKGGSSLGESTVIVAREMLNWFLYTRPFGWEFEYNTTIPHVTH